MTVQYKCPAGVPPGVVNVVFGTGPRAGDALVGHPDVPLISFTGSTATAQRITERSAPYYKKLSLELGGKNPAIVFADADLDKCVEATVRSSFLNQVSKKVLALTLQLVFTVTTKLWESQMSVHKWHFDICVSNVRDDKKCIIQPNGPVSSVYLW